MLLKNPWKSIPFVRMLIPFVAGIIVQFSFSANGFFILPALLISFSALFGLHLYFRKLSHPYYNWIFGISLYVFLFFVGTSIALNEQRIVNKSNLPEMQTITNGTIISYPVEKKKTVAVILECDIITEEKQYRQIQLRSFINKDSASLSLKYGDVIRFKSYIDKIKNPGNPYEFDYKKYLENHGIYNSVYINANSWEKINTGQGNAIFRVTGEWRDKLLGIYKEFGVTGKEFSVAAALTLGYKNELDNETKRVYSSSGAMHILAVSGLHVGIVLLFLNIVFKPLSINRKSKMFFIFLTITLLWLFALLTGLSPSVTRAATMFSFIEAGKLIRRKSSIYNTLAVSAFVILIVSPLSIFEIGFQLSYIAVLAIVILYPMLSELYQPKTIFGKKIWDLLIVSLAAQIGTFPIGILYFHQFPNYFFLTNLFAIPLATIIIFNGIFLCLLSWIKPFGIVLGYSLNKITEFLNFLTNGVDQLPFSSTQDLFLTGIDAILIYLSIATTILFIVTYRKKFIFVALGAITFIFCLSLIKTTSKMNDEKFIVYNINKTSAYNFVSGKYNIVICDTSVKNDYRKLKFAAYNNWLHNSSPRPAIFYTDETENNFHEFSENRNILIKNNKGLITIRFKNKTLAYFDKFSAGFIASTKKLTIDYLIINRNFKNKIDNVLNTFEIKNVIIDSSISDAKAEKIMEKCLTLNIASHSVKKTGAYIVE